MLARSAVLQTWTPSLRVSSPFHQLFFSLRQTNKDTRKSWSDRLSLLLFVTTRYNVIQAADTGTNIMIDRSCAGTRAPSWETKIEDRESCLPLIFKPFYSDRCVLLCFRSFRFNSAFRCDMLKCRKYRCTGSEEWGTWNFIPFSVASRCWEAISFRRLWIGRSVTRLWQKCNKI